MDSPDNSFGTESALTVGSDSYRYYAVNGGEFADRTDVARLPVSSKILLENLLRHEDGFACSREDIAALAASGGRGSDQEIAYHPARVLMQDFTGVPAVVDLSAMRAALVERGIDPETINPLLPVDLVIDHSVSIDSFASESAFGENVAMEMQRNLERYQFLKWGQGAFDNFRVVPPGTGICHQVNLEYLARAVWHRETETGLLAYPDTLVGTDSHTTMINGLGVLGWGVGGIEAEAAMLGQPISMVIPDVVGFELSGQLQEGITATDLVLRVVEMLREHGVVGKFVEFFGQGLDQLPLADRATIANMAPEYGATCGFFPVDAQTITYLRLSGRDEDTIALVEAYCKAQGMWRDENYQVPDFAATLHLDMTTVEPNLAGPRRPQDRVPVRSLKAAIDQFIELEGKAQQMDAEYPLAGEEQGMHHGDAVIAAITSCTNTSNPAVMIGAGLVAQKALALGLQRKPWVKTSLAPGSKVVTEYLEKAGLQDSLDGLGFNLVGYGCTTCIGNSGPLPAAVEDTIQANDLVVSSVLSGNRNFEGRIHPLVQANWLASPPLVVAYALAGTTRINLAEEPLGEDSKGQPVYLRDIWPSNTEIAGIMQSIDNEMFKREYAAVFAGDGNWNAIDSSDGSTYDFEPDSTYIQLPPFFDPMYSGNRGNILAAPMLAMLGDSVTTDHISPAGSIPLDSPAAQFLRDAGVAEKDFNSYGSRRGNHEIMMRGTFGNIRIRNEMTPQLEGGYTRMQGESDPQFIYDAAMTYLQQGRSTVIVAGSEYGTGSSRDWAAKGTLLLGVKAVIVESFERIHRSNLVGMGVLPLQFMPGDSRQSLQLSGDESFDILDLDGELSAKQILSALVHYPNGESRQIKLQSRLDTAVEVDYYRAGGVLTYVLNRMSGTD
ncbi:aconitate hydratase AcnA [Halieaceae bacterium IMCC14734]|uniref:Aconitate hydratase n=1 Tax=Candidatus Litorirhabdus singularis TaxID=2518993 RepID=A0ABT3TAR0_9GAMM|nr:aconitate hydratase AcnA [Candidatus Litorirhabdus singularis]MCX2979275.1 aconitate hydratase AcnA [Candidatus Litorirhabdus singularis]